MSESPQLPPHLKVLVVDDLSTVRKVVAKILANIGITNVLQAKDGQEAFELVQRDRPDVIITDWEMPRLTGIELVKKLRAVTETATIPVLLITSHGQREKVLEAANCGISDFIVKPFGEEVIQKKLLAVLASPASTVS